MSEEEKLAYLAGIVDGEGSVQISKGKSTNGSWTYRLTLVVVNSDEKLMEWLERNFAGGVVKQRQKQNPKHRIVYVWSLYGKNARDLLMKLEQWVVIKTKQVNLGIDFYDKCIRRERKKRSLIMIERQKDYHEKMKALNQRGAIDEDMEARSSQSSTLGCSLADKQQRELLAFCP